MSEAEEFPQLDTERLVLRELTLADTDVVFPHFADKEVVRYEDAKPAASIEDVTEIIEWGRNGGSTCIQAKADVHATANSHDMGAVHYSVEFGQGWIVTGLYIEDIDGGELQIFLA